MVAEIFTKIKEQLGDQLPFVAYRKPSETVLKLIVQKDDVLHQIKDYTESGFVFAPFDTTKTAILIPLDKIYKVDYAATKPKEFIINNSIPNTQEQRSFHINLVKKGIKEIDKGFLKKVVLSRKLESTQVHKITKVFSNLLQQYPTAFCYLWYHPKVGLWSGATPETLVHIRNKQLSTMSLAGTQLDIGKTPIWQKKELEEQALVTNYIVDTLKNKVDKLTVSDLRSVKAAKLWHLHSSVSGILKSNNLETIIKALHPSPAVCGIPLERAKSFILENENYDRDFYAGYLGELNFKEKHYRSKRSKNQEHKAYGSPINISHLFVNLRCMQLVGDSAKIYVGGGITLASVPENEWQETVDKSATILNILLNYNN